MVEYRIQAVDRLCHLRIADEAHVAALAGPIRATCALVR